MEIVQRVTSSNNPASLAQPTAGNLLRVWVYSDTSSPVALAGSWELIAADGQASGPVSLACYAKLSDGTESSVAVSGTPPTQYRIEAIEVKSETEPWEAAEDAFLDALATDGAGVQTNSIATPQITTARPALLDAAFGCTTGTSSVAVGSGWTLSTDLVGGRLAVANRNGSPGTHQATFTFANNRHWAAGIVAIAEPPPPPPPPPPSTRELREAFLDALLDSHMRRITITIRDRDERPIDSLRVPASSRFIDGEVMGDVDADVTRSLSLQVIDPDNKLRLEGASPVEGALYADRFVSVEYGVYVERYRAWVDTGVFWGPVTSLSRDGQVVSIEAQGKESLGLAPHLATQGYTLPKGLRVDEAIERVLRKLGERRFNLPRITRTIGKPRTVRAEAEPWKVIKGGEEDANGKRIAGLVDRAPGNRYIFYDGQGRVTIRRRNQDPRWTIDGRALIDGPSVQYDALAGVNTVVVRGRVIDSLNGDRRRATSGPISLPSSHPLSPDRLARHDRPRYMVEVRDTELQTDAECRERAREILRRRAFSGVEASLTILPNPLIQELDVVRVTTDRDDFTFPVRFWTLPLGGGPMEIATKRRIRPKFKHRKLTKYSGSTGKQKVKHTSFSTKKKGKRK